MIKIREIDHLVLRILNLNEMLHFYCTVLGCTVERRKDEIGLVQLRAGKSIVDLVLFDSILGKAGGGMPRADAHNLDHFCLRVEPFDEPSIRHFLEENDIEVSPLGTRYGAEGMGPSIYISDPEGNVIELKGSATG